MLHQCCINVALRLHELGNNGYIWISPVILDDHQQEQMRFQLPSAPGSSSVETHTHVCELEPQKFKNDNSKLQIHVHAGNYFRGKGNNS